MNQPFLSKDVSSTNYSLIALRACKVIPFVDAVCRSSNGSRREGWLSPTPLCVTLPCHRSYEVREQLLFFMRSKL